MDIIKTSFPKKFLRPSRLSANGYNVDCLVVIRRLKQEGTIIEVKVFMQDYPVEWKSELKLHHDPVVQFHFDSLTNLITWLNSRAKDDVMVRANREFVPTVMVYCDLRKGHGGAVCEVVLWTNPQETDLMEMLLAYGTDSI